MCVPLHVLFVARGKRGETALGGFWGRGRDLSIPAGLPMLLHPHHGGRAVAVRHVLAVQGKSVLALLHALRPRRPVLSEFEMLVLTFSVMVCF